MSILQSILDSLLRDATASPPRRTPVPRPSGERIRGPVVVQRNTQRLFEERGWRWKGNTLEGFYRTKRGSFRGRIAGADGSSPEFYIEASRAILDGPHGACFQPRGPREFRVHWSTRPDSVDTGILRIEHTILEALS
ncbi:hypothetical protein PHYC_02037 [Phycisphaerales bacterium]|nr:hypothetical protein PHYC_02037 [Phycisphaerales bacterium]